jgi:hypothetical protein
MNFLFNTLHKSIPAIPLVVMAYFLQTQDACAGEAPEGFTFVTAGMGLVKELQPEIFINPYPEAPFVPWYGLGNRIGVAAHLLEGDVALFRPQSVSSQAWVAHASVLEVPPINVASCTAYLSHAPEFSAGASNRDPIELLIPESGIWVYECEYEAGSAQHLLLEIWKQ